MTANTALIMAIAMIAMPIICSRKQYLKQILLLIASAAVLFLSCRTGELNPIGSLVLAVIFILFIVQNLVSAKTDSNKQSGQAAADKKKLLQNSLLFLVGAAAIVLGSQLMVDNGSEIAVWLGVPERHCCHHAHCCRYLSAGTCHDNQRDCEKRSGAFCR